MALNFNFQGGPPAIIDLTIGRVSINFQRMTMGVEELIAAILRLPREDLARVLAALQAADTRAANAVRESAATYQIERPGESMTLVTMPLPDDLAEQARNAGLLAGKSLEQLIRKALEEHHASSATPLAAPRRKRRLVRNEYGYLVAEAFPGERPITTEEVKKILDDMEW